MPLGTYVQIQKRKLSSCFCGYKTEKHFVMTVQLLQLSSLDLSYSFPGNLLFPKCSQLVKIGYSALNEFTKLQNGEGKRTAQHCPRARDGSCRTGKSNK